MEMFPYMPSFDPVLFYLKITIVKRFEKRSNDTGKLGYDTPGAIM